MCYSQPVATDMCSIFELCGAGDAAGLSHLLAAGSGQQQQQQQGAASVRVVDSQGRTPLNLAVGSGSLDTVKVMTTFD
jgi:hypothetical protein